MPTTMNVVNKTIPESSFLSWWTVFLLSDVLVESALSSGDRSKADSWDPVILQLVRSRVYTVLEMKSVIGVNVFTVRMCVCVCVWREREQGPA